MVTKVKMNETKLNEIAAKFKALPKAPDAEMSKQEFIVGLSDQIKHATSLGYSLEQISDMLKAEGIIIPANSIRSYMPAKKAKKATVKTEEKTTKES